jgi:hypothetical protein
MSADDQCHGEPGSVCCDQPGDCVHAPAVPPVDVEATGGMPQYGIDRDFPLLCEKARQYDFAERLGGCSDPLMAEIDRALRELWDARRYVTGEASHAG